jgi:polysaccharide pyruvyl transferase CsaB
VNFLLSGYYGYGNAGDEAVLAAITASIASIAPQSTFVVTSGAPDQTQSAHASPQYSLRAIARQHPKSLVAAIRACDVFVSGGGSLLQDVTSVRNVVYYTSLIRFAALSRKPVMIYAHGVGPLRKRISQKLTRAAMQSAYRITVRDDESKLLLQRIGVAKPIEVTADPVWSLEADAPSSPSGPTWCVSMRSWVGREGEFGPALVALARRHGARLRFLPMQPMHDGPLSTAFLRDYADPSLDEIIDTTGMHPRAILAEAASCSLMIGMRLHALIFAASQRVPCVAINYDPKVESLAKIINAPCLPDWNDEAALEAAIDAARPLDVDTLKVLCDRASLNAQYTVALAR